MTNLIATTLDAWVQNAENDARFSDSIEEIRLREAEAAHDQVVEAFVNRKTGYCSESLVDVAQMNEPSQSTDFK